MVNNCGYNIIGWFDYIFSVGGKTMINEDKCWHYQIKCDCCGSIKRQVRLKEDFSDWPRFVKSLFPNTGDGLSSQDCAKCNKITRHILLSYDRAE